MRFFIKCTSNRISSTGMLYLAQHIDEFYSAVKYYPIVRDSFDEYGYIEGAGDVLSKALNACKYDFGVDRLFEEEFIGAVVAFFQPQVDPETEEITETLKQLLDKFSFNYQSLESGAVNEVYHVRQFKTKLFKEITKNKFNDYNDLIANMSKILLLLNEYEPTITTAQRTRLDACMTVMKSIYTVDTCLDALEEDIAKMGAVMPGYYTAKTQINILDTVETILAYQYT